MSLVEFIAICVSTVVLASALYLAHWLIATRRVKAYWAQIKLNYRLFITRGTMKTLKRRISQSYHKARTLCNSSHADSIEEMFLYALRENIESEELTADERCILEGFYPAPFEDIWIDEIYVTPDECKSWLDEHDPDNNIAYSDLYYEPLPPFRQFFFDVRSKITLYIRQRKLKREISEENDADKQLAFYNSVLLRKMAKAAKEDIYYGRGLYLKFSQEHPLLRKYRERYIGMPRDLSGFLAGIKTPQQMQSAANR